jgi:hypothetical protein
MLKAVELRIYKKRLKFESIEPLRIKYHKLQNVEKSIFQNTELGLQACSLYKKTRGCRTKMKN